MNSEEYCNKIKKLLAWLIAEVRIDAASNLHSINIHAEEFFRAFLNVLFGWELINANAADPNATGIDLLYPGGNVVVQVSSTTTHEKIQSSLEKTADYRKAHKTSGQDAHFYFLAIDDHLPDYRKPFEVPEGLIFNPETDILDTTRLHDRVVHCEDRDGKQSIDIQRELSELADKYFALRERRKALNLLPLGSGKASTDYEYNAGAVPFLGREAEMAQLLDFVRGNDEEPFRWWAITAPGAAGKTRLAYELQNKLLREGGWDVVALSPAAYRRENLLTLSEFLPARTLVIADYVQQHAEILGEWMAELAASGAAPRAPLRLLLLERDIKDENDRYPWLEQILNADYHIVRHSYQNAPLELRPLRPEKATDKDPLLVLIRDFADHVYQRETADAQGSEAAEAQGKKADEGKPVLTPLPPGGEEKIRERLNSVDEGLVRPLFAMLLADAWVHDPAAQRWQREELLEYIVNREWDFAAKRLRPYHPASNRSLPNACRLLWQAATVLGANGGNGADLETLKSTLPKAWAVVEKTANFPAYAPALLREDLKPEEALLTEAGLFEQGKVPGSDQDQTERGKVPSMRPDLLGEFFVLKALQAMPPAEASAFHAAILPDRTSTKLFFQRCLTDYEGLVGEGKELKSWFLPADLALTDEQKQLYVRLMRDLFEDARSLPPRLRLAACMEIWARTMGGGDRDAAVAYSDVGSVYKDLGDYPKAVEYQEKDLAITIKILGPAHPDTAASYNNLALVYDDMGDYPKALEYHQKALAIRETVLGTDHPDTATTYNNLASVYRAMGDYPRALEFQQKDLAITEKVMGPDHPDTATSYNNLASVYRAMGDYPKALEYHQKALAVQETVLGPDHPDTAASYNNLALVYDDMGDYPKALEYHEKALAIRETVLGPDHPSTATTYNNLALVYDDMGDYPKALDYYEKALAIEIKTLGPDHPSTAATYNNLASVYQAMGDYPKALEYYQKALAIRETVLVLDHPDTAQSFNNLALVYKATSDYPKALEYQQKALAIQETVLGPDHPDTAASYNNLASVYDDMGDYPKALEYYQKALAIRETVLGPDHPDTAIPCNNIGTLYLEQQNPKTALPWLRRALAVFGKALGPEHPNTKIVKRNVEYVERQIRRL